MPENSGALVVFLRGVNVGGHRTFRPSVVAKELRKFDVVNVGAAGTFVVFPVITNSVAEYGANVLVDDHPCEPPATMLFGEAVESV